MSIEGYRGLIEGALLAYSLLAIPGFVAGVMMAGLAFGDGYIRECRFAVRFAFLSLIWPLMIFPLLRFAFWGGDDD